MASNHDIRWQQRFQNYARAFALLHEALERQPAELSALEKEGAIRRFDYTVELAWKTLKDYLEAGGLVITPVTPRQVIKDAFAAKVIANGTVWIAMLDQRNLLSQTYDLAVFEAAVEQIASTYLPALADLHADFAQRSLE